MPILPGLNDSDKCLDAMARAASEAGAKFLYGNILFLTPSAMKQFMPFLEEEFPRLVKQYRKLYAHSAYLNGDYKACITKLLAELRARYGLEGNHGEPPPAARHPQLALPFEALDGSTAARGLLRPAARTRLRQSPLDCRTIVLELQGRLAVPLLHTAEPLVSDRSELACLLTLTEPRG